MVHFHCQAWHQTIPLEEAFAFRNCPGNLTGHKVDIQSLLGAVRQQGVACRLTAATSMD